MVERQLRDENAMAGPEIYGKTEQHHRFSMDFARGDDCLMILLKGRISSIREPDVLRSLYRLVASGFRKITIDVSESRTVAQACHRGALQGSSEDRW